MSLHHHLSMKEDDEHIQSLDQRITDLTRQRDEWREMANKLAKLLRCQYSTLYPPNIIVEYDALVKK